jgi:hypothetical protein
VDHSYRSGKTHGLLCRQHNAALGMFKDSPTLLKRALAYRQNPPAKALGFGENEKEKVKPWARSFGTQRTLMRPGSQFGL